MGEKTDKGPGRRIDVFSAFRKGLLPNENFPTFEELMEHDPEVAERIKDDEEARNAGPPQNPYEAAFIHVVELGKSAIRCEVSDPDRRQQMLLLYEEKFTEILAIARTGSTLQEQFDNLQAAGQVALFPKFKKKIGRKSQMPKARWVLARYEDFLPLVRGALGPGKTRNFLKAAKNLRDESEFARMNLDDADELVRLMPSQATVRIMAGDYGCSSDRVIQLLIEARKQRKAEGPSSSE